MIRKASVARLFLEVLVGLAGLAGLYLAKRYSFLLFHSLAEVFSVAVAFAIFLIVWNCRRFMQNGFLLFMGIVYLFVGCLDLVHTLAYTGMGVFPDYGTNLPTQLWIAARFIESAGFLTATFFIRRKVRPGPIMPVFGVITCGILVSIFLRRAFPIAYVEGVGLTHFKIYSEYVICGILILSVVLVTRQRDYFDRKIYWCINFSIILTMASEIAFTEYVSPFDYANLTGHYLKIASFYLIYKALVQGGLQQPYSLLFKDLEEIKTQVESARDELEIRVRERTEELARSEEKFRLIAETIQDVFWMSSPGIKKMLYVSPAYQRIWGRDPNELYRSPQAFLKTVHPEDRPKLAAGMSEHAQGRWEHEYRIVRPDGSLRWIRDRGFPIRGQDGTMHLMIRVASDVTGFKRIEEQVRRSRTRLVEAQRIAHLGNWEWDLTNRKLVWSDEVYRVLGESPGAFVPTYDAFLSHVHPEDRHLVQEALQKALAEADSYHIDHRVIHSDGSEHFVHMQGEVVCDKKRNPIRIAGTVQDITLRKEQEKKIQAHQKQLASLTEELLMAEERQRRRIATTLHDSVGQILAFAKIELSQMAKGTPASGRKTLHDVADQINEAIQLTRRLTYELSPTTLYTFGLEAALEELADKFTSRGEFVCHWQTHGDYPPLTEQIQLLLYRGVRELLINAAKHAHAENVHISACRSEDHLEITVQDDGEGFDVATLDAIPGEERGFGLFSIKERLTHVGGRFHAESEPGRGAKFILTAPSNLAVNPSEESAP